MKWTWGGLTVAVVVLIGVVVGVAVCRMSGDDRPASRPSDEKAVRPKSSMIADASAGKRPQIRKAKDGKKVRKDRGKAARTAVRPKIAADEDENFSPEEKKVLEGIQEALDDDRVETMRKSVRSAISCGNVEVMKRAIDACRWFGSKVLGELTQLAAAGLAAAEARGGAASAESAHEVVEEAIDAIDSCLDDIEDEAARAALVKEYMQTFTDGDVIEMLSGQLMTIGDEAIVVNTAVSLIDGGNAKAAEAAREAYEFATGEEYVSAEAAKKWLDENYEPPEPETE